MSRIFAITGNELPRIESPTSLRMTRSGNSSGGKRRQEAIRTDIALEIKKPKTLFKRDGRSNVVSPQYNEINHHGNFKLEPFSRNNALIDEEVSVDTKKSICNLFSITNNEGSINIFDEKIIQDEKQNFRKLKFREVFSDSQMQLSVGRILMDIMVTIIGSFMLTLVYSAIPLHNTIDHPEFWYEILLPRVVFCVFMGSSYNFIAGKALNVRHIYSLRRCLTTGFVYYISMVLLHSSAFFIWTRLLHLSWPLPFQNLLLFFICHPINFAAVYLQFLPSWRKNYDFNKRYFVNFLFSFYSMILTNIQYNYMAKLLINVPSAYQPIVSIFLPILKMMNDWIYGRFARNISNGDLEQTKIILKHSLTCRHSVFLCIAFGSYITDVTAWVLLIIKFLISIYDAVQLVRIRKKNPMAIEQQTNILIKLIINELVEFITPLAFLLSLVAAFYGPNASLFGGIGSDLWQFVAIQDISKTIKSILMFCFADLFSIVAVGTLLWKKSRINIFKALMVLQDEYKLVFGITSAGAIFAVSIIP